MPSLNKDGTPRAVWGYKKDCKILKRKAREQRLALKNRGGPSPVSVIISNQKNGIYPESVLKAYAEFKDTLIREYKLSTTLSLPSNSD